MLPAASLFSREGSAGLVGIFSSAWQAPTIHLGVFRVSVCLADSMELLPPALSRVV